MKTIKEKINEIKEEAKDQKIVTWKSKVFITSDGAEFRAKNEAVEHEKELYFNDVFNRIQNLSVSYLLDCFYQKTGLLDITYKNMYLIKNEEDFNNFFLSVREIVDEISLPHFVEKMNKNIDNYPFLVLGFNSGEYDYRVYWETIENKEFKELLDSFEKIKDLIK